MWWWIGVLNSPQVSTIALTFGLAWCVSECESGVEPKIGRILESHTK